MERWLWDFSETVARLPCLSTASLTSLHPPLLQHSWSSVNHLPSMGRAETIHHHVGWPNILPKFPLSTAAVFRAPSRSLDSMLLLEQLHFLSAKSPPLPIPSLNGNSPSANRDRVAWVWQKSPFLICAQLILGQRKENEKLFAVMYSKSITKITLVQVHIPSALAFCQLSSKHVPRQECLLKQYIAFFRRLYKVELKYVAVSIYLSNLNIKTALIHLKIRNIPGCWCVQKAKL